MACRRRGAISVSAEDALATHNLRISDVESGGVGEEGGQFLEDVAASEPSLSLKALFGRDTKLLLPLRSVIDEFKAGKVDAT